MRSCHIALDHIVRGSSSLAEASDLPLITLVEQALFVVKNGDISA
jgi:hypothetical protein